jgi:hypothetical protein
VLRLLRFWETFGWGGHGNGLFWIVDPEPYAPVVEAWLGYEPALIIGGNNELKNLRKVNAVVHMSILAEFGEKQIWKNMRWIA